MGKSKLSEGQQNQAKKLRSEGLSYKEIADKMLDLYQIKISFHAIRALCIKDNVIIDGRNGPARKYNKKDRKIKIKKPRVNKGVSLFPPDPESLGGLIVDIERLVRENEALYREKLNGLRLSLLKTRSELQRSGE